MPNTSCPNETILHSCPAQVARHSVKLSQRQSFRPPRQRTQPGRDEHIQSLIQQTSMAAVEYNMRKSTSSASRVRRPMDCLLVETGVAVAPMDALMCPCRILVTNSAVCLGVNQGQTCLDELPWDCGERARDKGGKKRRKVGLSRKRLSTRY
jgi:hypothetical protein